MRWAGFEPIRGAANGAVNPWAQILIAGGAVGAMLALLIVGKPVPPELWSLIQMIAAFYFGVGAGTILRR